MTIAQAIIIATLAGKDSVKQMVGKTVISPITKQEQADAEAVLGDDFYNYYDQAVDAAIENI